MTSKKALLMVLVLSGFGSAAQNPSDLPPNSPPFNLNGQVLKTFDDRYEGVRGTYLFQDIFNSGIVDLKKGQIKDTPINYDAYTDNVLAKRGDIVYTLRKDLIIGFTLTTSDGHAYKFIAKNIDQRQTFLMVIQEQPGLYCRVTKILKRTEAGGAYNSQQNNYDEFIWQNSYYTEKNGALLPVKANKKSFIAALPGYKEKIENYLKQTKVDFVNYDEIIQMMQLLTLN